MHRGWPKQTSRKSEQRFREPPDLELVHSDSNRAMFSISGDLSTEEIQAEIARRGDAMIDERSRTSKKHWMASEPLVPIQEAFGELMRLSTVDGRPPHWLEAFSNTIDDLKVDSTGRPNLDGVISAMLSALLKNHVDSKILKASGIYSGVESLLICPEASICTKAVELVNMWRKSQNMFPLEVGMTALAAYAPDRLKTIYGPMDIARSTWTGTLFGLLWAAELTRCNDFPLRLYATKTLMNAAAYLLPERESTKLNPLVDIKDLGSYFQDLRKAYPMLDGHWQDNMLRDTEKIPTLVDRWEALHQVDLTSNGGPEAYLKSIMDMGRAKDMTEANRGEEYSSVLLDAVKQCPISTQGHISQRLRPQHDCGGCVAYPSLKDQSDFFLRNASASLNTVMSEIEDEDKHVHHQIDPITFEEFRSIFDKCTRLCHGILPKLTKEIRDLHTAWPGFVCEIESNMRRAMYGEQVFTAMSETLQNMEKSVAAYGDDLQDYERQAAYNDIRDLRQSLESCEDEKYMPTTCNLHQIQNKLMSMICQPVKALWELESVTAADLQRQIEAKTAQNDELSIQAQAKGSELSRVQSRLNTSETKLKTTKTKLEGAERAAEAKAHIEIEKQKSRYYQDVEKGVSENSSALRSQLEAARAEGLLCRQTLADNEKLNAEMAKMKQEMAHLKAVKSQKEKDCKLAEDATKAITEGYDQLKETAATAEARNAELEADLEKAFEEQDLLRNENRKLKVAKKATVPSHSSSTANYAEFAPTSLEEKNKKELQHLDSTMVVWKKILAETEAKRDKTKEKKEHIDLRIAHVEKQVKELKEAKKPKTKPSSAATPPAQQATTTSVPPANPIVVPSAVRRTQAEQDNFPALGAAAASANTLRGDAPAFSSMRIMSSAAGGTNMRGLATRNSANRNVAGSKKGEGSGQGHQGGGGWGN